MQTVPKLLEQFNPLHYEISIDIHREERTFTGVVTIYGNSTTDMRTISLHAKNLTIESTTLDGKKADFSAGEHDELTITHHDIAKGDHVVVISYSGIINDSMHGMYPCYYEYNGKKKELIATQFESHHAREVFPCVDEPAAKATFDVTLTTEQDVSVLGNMPIVRQDSLDNRLVTSFDTTPKMSTYLLAWVIGNLNRKTAMTKSGVEVNVWATPAQPTASLDFALDIATRTIDFFDEYFETPYPLPKSDHVALPDFSSGAMENWGLITYREMALLADPDTTSISSKHYIATVIAHELSHQWFGNLVTMKWWNDLWLNESFATLMEYIAIDALHPEWDIWLDFSTNESIMALRRDSIEGIQPVQIDVNHPDEISTLFDGAIVYAKGARLLRMLRQYIGKENFQNGLKNYFSAHAYDNTVGEDLWKSLSEVSGKNISEFMNTWISQSGYPVVHVNTNTDKKTITLKQEQFFTGPHKPSTKLWPIPLGSNSDQIPELLTNDEISIEYTPNNALRLNIGDSAHFITHYQPQMLGDIIKELYSGTYSPIDRLQALHEQIALSRAGVINNANLIPLIKAYGGEDSEAVWDIISMAIGVLKKFVENDELATQKLRKLSRDIAETQYKILGWTAKPGESEETTKLRSTIVSLMLYGEDSDAIKSAHSLYQATSLESLPPELRSSIISSEVKYSNNPDTVDSLLEIYKNTQNANLQQDLALGITATKDKESISKLLDAIKDSSIIRKQDVHRWFVYLLRNTEGRDLTWQWLKINWQWIEDTFAGDKSYNDFPRYSSDYLNTREQLNDYIAFFEPLKNIPALNRAIIVGVSEIEGRVELIERDNDAVRSALVNI